jgi:hypothetical protein
VDVQNNAVAVYQGKPRLVESLSHETSLLATGKCALLLCLYAPFGMQAAESAYIDINCDFSGNENTSTFHQKDARIQIRDPIIGLDQARPFDKTTQGTVVAQSLLSG